MAARLLLLLALPAVALGTEAGVAKNPIRKVVTMLQGMFKTVTEEGEKEEKAFEEFMCYCKTGVGDLETSIESATTKIDTLESRESLEKKKLTEGSLSEHKDSRAEAKEAVAKAEALRASENAAFKQEKSDSETNISAIKAAVAALEKGMGASFLQSGAAKRIAQFAMEKATMADAARQDLLSFLSGSADYAPKSGEITGILKQMGDEMTASLEEAIAAEEKAQGAFNEMVAAKTKEINTVTAQIEEEMLRLGELNVLLAESGNDLDETKETLKEDTSYLAELKKGCSTKEAEWQERCKVRQEELVAISETIKILNDDDALELFKKTLPSTSVSFLQVKESARDVRRRALDALRAEPSGSPRLNLVMLAIQGKTAGFEKVIALVDDMMATLKKEQADDDAKREYCEAELDKTEDQKKELERAIEVSSTAIEELTGAIATWTSEISDLKAGILALDKSVAEATKLRKEQNAEYKQLIEESKATKEILLFAKNRLNKWPTYGQAPRGSGAGAGSQDRQRLRRGTAAPAGDVRGLHQEERGFQRRHRNDRQADHGHRRYHKGGRDRGEGRPGRLRESDGQRRREACDGLEGPHRQGGRQGRGRRVAAGRGGQEEGPRDGAHGGDADHDESAQRVRLA
ncbi:unnamed protein product, partial [Prorocentrum cordatum]